MRERDDFRPIRLRWLQGQAMRQVEVSPPLRMIPPRGHRGSGDMMGSGDRFGDGQIVEEVSHDNVQT